MPEPSVPAAAFMRHGSPAPGVPPRSRVRLRRRTRPAALWSATTALVVMLFAIAAPLHAQDDADRTAANSDEVTGEDLESASERSGSLGPPEGFEVLRVRGRSLDAIKTDVPDSVTSFDQATLAALGAQDVSDLARVTPNVEIVSGGATQASFFIRGVGLTDFSSNAAGAVAIFQDEIAVNSQPLQLGQLFDVANVELLRGPQGYGPNRNASGGAIRATSQKPTGLYTAELKTSLGTWDPTTKDASRGLIQDYEGAIEVPLVEGVLSTRLAFRFHDAEPYRTNGCGNAPPIAARIDRGPNRPGLPAPGASICGESATFMFDSLGPQSTDGTGKSLIPTGLDDKVGNEHNWAARAQLRLQPENTDMDWLLNAHGSRLNQQSTLGQALGTGPLQGGSVGATKATVGGVVGFNINAGYWEPDQKREWLRRCPTLAGCNDEATAFGKKLASGRPLDSRPYRGDYNRVGLTQLDSWGGFLRGDIAIGDVKLMTISGYDGYHRKVNQDADFTPHRLFEFDNEDRLWQVWQQVSLSGELEVQPIRWDAGGYYFMENLDVRGYTFAPYNTQPPSREATTDLRDYSQNIYSFGLWGSGTWEIYDDFTLEAGIRYNWERKDFNFRVGKPNCIVQRNPPFTVTCFPFFRAKQDVTWGEPTGSVRLTYRFNDELSAYWKYTRGFKSGHFNARASTLDVEQPPADPEKIDSFEAGLRGSFFDNRIAIGGAMFYYIYEDYQLFLFTDSPQSTPVLEVVNANDAQLYGAEIEMKLEPLSGLVYDTWDGLVINLRFGWLEGEFIDFQNEGTGNLPNGATFVKLNDFTGNRLPNTPRFTLSGDVQWSFDLGRWGSIIPRYDFSWSDDTVFDPNEGQGTPDLNGNPRLPTGTVGQTAYWIHNVRLTYRAPTSNMEVSAWVRNIEDTVYKDFAFDASSFQRLTVNFVGQPRTIGVDLQFTF